PAADAFAHQNAAPPPLGAAGLAASVVLPLSCVSAFASPFCVCEAVAHPAPPITAPPTTRSLNSFLNSIVFPRAKACRKTVVPAEQLVQKAGRVLTPTLFYDDVGAALQWLARAFGFEVTERYHGPDRLHYLDGLGVERLGVMYQVHASTAARRLASARQAWLD